MYKLLISISIISVAFFHNPIISLTLGLILGFIMKDNLKEFISNVGSMPLQIGIRVCRVSRVEKCHEK